MEKWAFDTTRALSPARICRQLLGGGGDLETIAALTRIMNGGWKVGIASTGDGPYGVGFGSLSSTRRFDETLNGKRECEHEEFEFHASMALLHALVPEMLG